MTLPLVLLNRRRIGGFNPRAILAGSTAFLWLDPSDLTTLFQDAAGTTPVTAPAQPVGLVLDKGQGLVLGPELVTNGDFSSATGWTQQTGWAIGSGVLTGNVAAAAFASAFTSISLVAGRSYSVTYSITAYTSGQVRVGFTGTTDVNGITRSSAGTFTQILVAAAGNASVRLQALDPGFVGTIDNISVRELPGFHATQSTAANRPTYGVVPSRGRVNLLTFTEDFSNAAWNKGNTTVTAPDANGWIRLQASTTASILVSQTANGAGSASGNTFTIQVKKGSGATDANRFGFRNNTTATDLILVTFNYDTGVVSGTGAADVTVTAGANAGEWTLRFTPSSGISAGNNLIVYTCFTGLSEASTEFAFVRYPQLETGSTTSPYQRVASQFEVTDPAGFPSYPLHYLFFGGDLDPRWLQTSTITPNADKVQVFAGVRKLSDAAAGVVAELSATSTTNNGSFALLAPVSAAGNLFWRSRGTATAEFTVTGYNAPISTVLTGTGDISGDLALLRVNGTQAAQSTADQGTGNYLAYPLFIGRRGGTSFAFNGLLFQLIARWSVTNLDASLVSQTERFTGQKSGVTI